ncbi:MAG: MBL fold metallo-hydrolase, partial [Thermotaleaceae bacterium]
MRPKLYAINVGRGDLLFLEIPMKNRENYIIMIDGGYGTDKEIQVVLELLEKNSWNKIDLLIITHLHFDHVGGMPRIAEVITFSEALLPYPKFQVESIDIKNEKAKLIQETFKIYKDIFEVLEKTSTKINISRPFMKKHLWNLGEYILKQVNPIMGDEALGYKIIKTLTTSTLSEEEREHLLIEFDKTSNLDSSIWTLSKVGEEKNILILGGDALLPSWERLIDRESIKSSGIKIPHHGIVDAMNEVILKEIEPQWFLITSSQEEFQKYQSIWRGWEIESKSKMYVTGEIKETKWVEIMS